MAYGDDTIDSLTRHFCLSLLKANDVYSEWKALQNAVVDSTTEQHKMLAEIGDTAMICKLCSNSSLASLFPSLSLMAAAGLVTPAPTVREGFQLWV